jgi:hypothetical protein
MGFLCFQPMLSLVVGHGRLGGGIDFVGLFSLLAEWVFFVSNRCFLLSWAMVGWVEG